MNRVLPNFIDSQIFTYSFFPRVESPIQLLNEYESVDENRSVNENDKNKSLEMDDYIEMFVNQSIGFYQKIVSFLSFLQIGLMIFSEYICYLFCFYIYFNRSYSYSYFIGNIFKKLAQYNILYVKLFQALALNEGFDLNNELIEFTDRAPYHTNEIDYETLKTLLFENDLVLEKMEPINSGMISIVFLARERVHHSKSYIIKMKRNGIEEKLRDGIEGILSFLSCLSFLSSVCFLDLLNLNFVKKYKLVELIERNIEIIQQQTDFQKEVKNIKLVKRNCGNLKYVVIPEVYSHITDRYKNVILMDFVEGKTLAEINSYHAVEGLKKEDSLGFAKSVLKFGFVTSFLRGVTHGDLHCGNIVFIKDDAINSQYPYKIGVFDFGILCELEEEFRNALFESILGMMERPVKDTARMILESGIIVTAENRSLDLETDLSEENKEEIVALTSKIIGQVLYESKKANQYQLYSFLKEFDLYLCKNELQKMGLKISDHYVKVQLVLAMAHGVTMKLCQENYIEVADQVIHELFYPSLILGK
jgi:predicted unusual protein kinase regulating ubiquinone biosynthesis (AarF/ABC1/UbiB family)